MIPASEGLTPFRLTVVVPVSPTKSTKSAVSPMLKVPERPGAPGVPWGTWVSPQLLLVDHEPLAPVLFHDAWPEKIWALKFTFTLMR